MMDSSVSGNLIDFKSPAASTILPSPLIPAPYISYSNRDSIENNPFDKILKEANFNAIKTNDPFEFTFEKAQYLQNDNKENMPTPKTTKSASKTITKNIKSQSPLLLTETKIAENLVLKNKNLESIKFSENIELNKSLNNSSFQCLSDSLLENSLNNELDSNDVLGINLLKLNDSTNLLRTPENNGLSNLITTPKNPINNLDFITPKNTNRNYKFESLEKKNENLSPDTKQEIKNTVAKRISLCMENFSPNIENIPMINVEETSPPLINMRKSLSANNVSLSNKFPEYINSMSTPFSYKNIKSDTRPKLNLTSSSISSVNTNIQFDSDILHKSFSQRTIKRSYDNSIHENNFPLFNRKSLSARKPNKYDINKGIFSVKTRDNLVDSAEFTEFLNLSRITDEKKDSQNLDDSVFLEANLLATTFSNIANKSHNDSESDSSVENLMSIKPEFKDLAENTPKKATTNTIFKLIDKKFPENNALNTIAYKSVDDNNLNEIENEKNVDPPVQNRVKTFQRSISLSDNIGEEFSKRQNDKTFDTVKFLKSLTEVFQADDKNTKERKALGKNLMNSLAKVLNISENEESVKQELTNYENNASQDSTKSIEDAYFENEINSSNLINKSLPKQLDMKPKSKLLRSNSLNSSSIMGFKNSRLSNTINKNEISNKANISLHLKNTDVNKKIMKRSISETTSISKNKPLVICDKRNSISNVAQTVGNKLRPKRSINSINPSAGITKKGPLKAIIPINNMAKIESQNTDALIVKKCVPNAPTEQTTLPIFKRKLASTPEMDISKDLRSKPIAQSTPDPINYSASSNESHYRSSASNTSINSGSISVTPNMSSSLRKSKTTINGVKTSIPTNKFMNKLNSENATSKTEQAEPKISNLNKSLSRIGKGISNHLTRRF